MFHKLSVVIITHNEEKMLPDCLKSINWADEIIILDYKSTDMTCYIGKKFGAHVYHSNTWNGFGKQRQLAQKYATGDYILTLDADERVTIQLKKSILSILKKKTNNNIVYACSRRSLFLKRWMKYSGWYPDFVIRLYSRKTYFYDSMKVHEKLKINNAIINKLKGDLLHITCQYLPKFQKKQLYYAETWALENYKKKTQHNIFLIISYTIGTFLKTLLIDSGWLDGKYGLLLAIIKSQYTFNKYIILWTLKSKNKKQNNE